MINAGALRHSITIQVRSSTQDAAGQTADTWTTFATRRAALEQTPGREVFASAQRGGRVPTVFRLRYLAGVLTSMRVSYDSRIFNILSAVPDSVKSELVLTCEELVEAAP